VEGFSVFMVSRQNRTFHVGFVARQRFEVGDGGREGLLHERLVTGLCGYSNRSGWPVDASTALQAKPSGSIAFFRLVSSSMGM